MSDITRLRPGLWIVEAALEDFDVRAVVLAGSRRAIVWDTLARPSDMEGVAELVPDLPLTVVYSHGDWDHVWGTGGLARRPDEVVAHEGCKPRFRTELPATLLERREQAPGSYDGVTLTPPDRVFRERLRLELGGLALELHSLPGHTPDSIVGFVPGWGLFLAGDAVETPVPFLTRDSGPMAWAEALERWASRLENSLVVPSHGPLGGAELLRDNASYLTALAEGRVPSLPMGMTPFYRETHAANVEIVRSRWPASRRGSVNAE